MRKQLTFLSIMASVMPFSFYELDGPFGVRIAESQNGGPIVRSMINNETGQLTYPIERLNLTTDLGLSGVAGPVNVHSYIFMYNGINGYSIGYDAPKMSPSNRQIVNFFLGNNSFEKGYKGGWDNDYTKFKFCFLKESLNLVVEGSQEPLKGCFEKNIDLASLISLDAEFTTTSGIKFVNKEDGPEVSMGKKEVKVGVLLKRLFNTNASAYQSNLVDVIAKRKLEDNTEHNSMLNTYELQNIDKLFLGITLDEKQADLFGKSKILAVYNIFKNDNGKESLIWGLAEVADESQPSGKRKFHWMTDIKCNISELLK